MNSPNAEQTEFEIGAWAYSLAFRESVRIIDVQRVWGHTSYQIWLQGKETLSWVDEVDLRAAERTPEPDDVLNETVYRASAARIIEGLSQDVLLAPLEAGVIPLPHQLEALKKAMSGDQVRYLFADEVGLGKTIEAGLVIRELKLRGLAKRILVVAPKGLVPQWVQEMKTHFSEDFRLLSPSDFSTIRHLVRDDNIWKTFDQVVCPVDSVKPLERRKGWSKEKLEEYNQERLGDLVAAGWDLIVIDEAHRLGGSTDTVARYKLGRALSEAAPDLLLLSATPHQGKTESFRRLMSLIDEEAFPDAGSIKKDKVAPYVVRTEKRRAINDRGEPLFQPRVTKLIGVKWEERHALQKSLYYAVTEYVRQGYDQAVRDNRQYLGFLMILMQRLVTSSTHAIASSLERRLGILNSTEFKIEDFNRSELDWSENDGQQLLEDVLETRTKGVENELKEVSTLLETARRCKAQGPDARAEALLDLIYEVQREESDPKLKILIFTEFVPTQQMLARFLGDRGFSNVSLNGSLDLESRQRVQREFTEDIQVLISTDAGGEGLNLQHAHVIINYDLPWNPMRIEQRIGRVDRIGQQHPVKAFNLIFDDSVEMRVHEVLETKLKTILGEFGVDKTADVLDSAESGAEFEKVFANAIVQPNEIETNVDKLMLQVRERAEYERDGNAFYDEVPLDPALANRLGSHPMPFWIERMVTSYLQSRGGEVEKDLLSWQLAWPDKYRLENVCFHARTAYDNGLHHLSLEDQHVRDMLDNLAGHTPDVLIQQMRIHHLAAELSGWWSLWQITLKTKSEHFKRILPMFIHDDGRSLRSSARSIWDQLIQVNTKVEVTGRLDPEASQKRYAVLKQLAEENGKLLFEELVTEHKSRLHTKREKGEYAFTVRRKALNRIGLPQVRNFRLLKMEEEYNAWESNLSLESKIIPDLKALLILNVGAFDG